MGFGVINDVDIITVVPMLVCKVLVNGIDTANT
jgi:hypothetical protein